jgi:hypothetical protein
MVADEPGPWAEAGFVTQDGLCEVGSVRIRLAGSGEERGIVGWSVRGLASTELDGLETAISDRPAASGAPHPNGTIAIDHLVAFSPDLERSVEALRGAGLDFRRLREGETPGGSTRQAFFRMGEVLLEVVEAPQGSRIRRDRLGPARLWGISFLVEDLAGTAAFLGDRLGEPREAVQPGRRIATLSHGAGLGPAIAFITPGAGAA